MGLLPNVPDFKKDKDSMDIKKFLKKYPIIGKPLLYLFHKQKNGHLVRFWYSTHLSPRCEFEGMNMVHPHSSFYGRLGLGSYIGSHTHLNADIGRFTSIAPRVTCINGTHPLFAPFATTCPLFFSLNRSKNPNRETFAKRQIVNEYRQVDKERGIDIRIGNDCWIGSGVTFLGGVTIHDGAVVLTNATVTKDVPPYAIVGGVPARIIKYRYDNDTIDFLLRTKWWNNTIDWFRENGSLLCDIDKLKNYYEQHDKETNT